MTEQKKVDRAGFSDWALGTVHIEGDVTRELEEAFSQVPLPSRPVERGRPGPGLLAHVLIGKYCDHLPLDRQSKIFAREKVDLHRTTLTDRMGRSTALLELLADHIGKLVRAGPALFADDTSVKLQTRTRMKKTKAQFTNCMHGRAMAVARQARGEAFSSSSRWNHRR